MKLVTFQTPEALSILQKRGVLVVDPSHIDLKKYGVPYDWIVGEMKKRKILPFNKEQYPLWAWAKCGSCVAPRKRKNCSGVKQNLVKITFEKPDKEVLLSDYIAYSFILSGHIVPRTKEEYRQFLQKVQKEGISLETLKGFVRKEKVDENIVKLFSKIEKTWPRIFHLTSNVHQACMWNIKLSEVVKIEHLGDSNYIYGSMNAKRKDGSRPDWKKAYLKLLSN